MISVWAFSKRVWLNFEADNSVVALEGIMHLDGNIKMVIDHNFAQSFKFADWNAVFVIWRQFFVLFVSQNCGTRHAIQIERILEALLDHRRKLLDLGVSENLFAHDDVAIITELMIKR